MSKRELNNKERQLTRQAVEKIKKDLPWVKYQKEISERNINYGMKLAFERQMDEEAIKLKNFESELGLMNQQIKIYTDQLTNGVEEVEKVIEEKE